MTERGRWLQARTIKKEGKKEYQVDHVYKYHKRFILCFVLYCFALQEESKEQQAGKKATSRNDDVVNIK